MQGDSSRYGLINAVTAASKIAKSYDRATELERIGGEILSLPHREICFKIVFAIQKVFFWTFCNTKTIILKTLKIFKRWRYYGNYWTTES